MYHFALLPEAAKQLRKAVHIRMVFTTGLIVVIALVFPEINIGSLRLSPFSDWSNLIIPVAIFFAKYLWDLRKATKIAASYKLTVSDEVITREADNAATRLIPIHEVRIITKCPDESYVITGDGLFNFIRVPTGIERAEELERLLTAIKPLTLQSQKLLWYRFQYPLMAAYALLLVGAFFVEDMYVSSVLGIVLSAIVGYSWLTVQKNKFFDKRERLVSHFVLIIPVLVVVRMIWYWTM